MWIKLLGDKAHSQFLVEKRQPWQFETLNKFKGFVSKSNKVSLSLVKLKMSLYKKQQS